MKSPCRQCPAALAAASVGQAVVVDSGAEEADNHKARRKDSHQDSNQDNRQGNPFR